MLRSRGCRQESGEKVRCDLQSWLDIEGHSHEYGSIESSSAEGHRNVAQRTEDWYKMSMSARPVSPEW